MQKGEDMSLLSTVCVVLVLAFVSGCTGERARDDVERARVKSPVMVDSIPGSGALEAVRDHVSDIKLGTFYQSDYWQDGKAEVAQYEATRERYGKVRRFTMKWITVKEEFNPELLVKSDSSDSLGLIPVMKSHAVFTMPTDNYDYNFAASTFFRRDAPAALVKFTGTSHEWCGITSKHLDLKGDEPIFSYHSYFESEHDGVTKMSWPKGGVLESQLMGLVRAIPFDQESWSAPVNVLDRQVTSHMRPLKWREGTLKVRGEREVEDARGTSHKVWHVVFVSQGKDVLSYDVSKAKGHVVIAHQGPDGATMRLREQVRWAYWNFSNPSPFTTKEP